MKLIIISAIITIATLTGCVQSHIQVPTQPPVIIDDPGKSSVQYVDYWPKKEMQEASIASLKAYGSALLSFEPKDKSEWCMGSDKLAFYNKLLSAIAKYESGYDPNNTYKENFKDNHGNYVISVGLMQVSSESCNGYGMKYLVNSELKKNSNNLECAARILNKWIPRDGNVSQGSLGAGRYWSVMRIGSIHKRESIKAMVCK